MLTIDLNTNVLRCKEITGPCRYAGKGFLYEDKIIWAGSSDASGNRTEQLNLSMYDLARNEWSNCPTTGFPPAGLEGFSGDFIQQRKRFVVFGGKKPRSLCISDVVLTLLDVETKRWIHPVVKGEMPSNRSHHGSCVHKGQIYFYGGIGCGRYGDGIRILQLSSRDIATWSKPKIVFDGIIPFQLHSFALVPFQGVLLFCGGVDKSITGIQTLRIYDPQTGKLSAVSPKAQDEFKSYGIGLSAFPLVNGEAVGVFGSSRNCESYLKLSCVE